MSDEKRKVLLVEDQNFVAELYLYHLQKAGFEVDVSEDGDQALKLLKENKYQLILLDIMLPGTNGLEILKKCRSGKMAPDSLIIMLTNLSQDMTIRQAFKEGANGYLVKAAYTPQQIITEIKNFLSGGPTQLINTTPPEF